MNLKVVRYKNYGLTMSSMPGKDIYDNNFFWSFYELNNGKIIVLNYVENLTNNNVISNSYEFFYAKHELKSGEIINYEFGSAKAINKKEMSKEFYDWFDSNPPAKDLKELKFPNKDEKKCVKEFFIKNIMETKEVATAAYYENGCQTGESILYDKSNNLIRSSQFSNGKYLNICTEFYEGGNIRMTQNKSNYKFYDNNSNVRCEIYIQSEILTMDKFRANADNCWYKWHWNEDTRIIYKPTGVWKEFDDSGNLVFDLNFDNYDTHKYKKFNVLKTNYDSKGAITSTELISPQELHIERFAANFSYVRLVDKKASYRTVHLNPGGWRYAEFSIPSVLTIGDIIKINTATNNLNA